MRENRINCPQGGARWPFLLLCLPLFAVGSELPHPSAVEAAAKATPVEVAASDHSAEKSESTSEQQVAKRAAQRWKAIMERDWGTAYGYLSPGARELLSADAFAQNASMAALRWQEAEVIEVECKEEICRVNVRVSYLYQGLVTAAEGLTLSDQRTENWLYSDGEWWLAPTPRS